jgi:hypothetical protein
MQGVGRVVTATPRKSPKKAESGVTIMFGDVSAALIKSRPVKFVLGFVVCIIISILCFELAARFFLPDMIAVWRGLPFGDGAIQFVSAGAVQNIDGFPTYRSNADVRLVVFYPDGNGNPVKEYDCSFRSDQNGFVSNEIEYSRAKVLLLGDSFSVGFGGCEWVSRLKTDFKKKVYVAAHGGFGPIVWKNVVSYLEEKKRPEKILIVFVTDDFFRPGWLYSRTQLNCINFKAECEAHWLFPITANMAEVARDRIARIRNSAGCIEAVGASLGSDHHPHSYSEKPVQC